MQGPNDSQMRGRVSIDDQGPDFPKETSVEIRCLDAFAAVSHFERTHCLALQVQLLHNFLIVLISRKSVNFASSSSTSSHGIYQTMVV